jgi:hypothetical protein
MTGESLHDKMVAYLFMLMAEHIDRGVAFDEALILGVNEIRRQIRESRGDLVEMLIGNAVHDIHYVRENTAKLH